MNVGALMQQVCIKARDDFALLGQRRRNSSVSLRLVKTGTHVDRDNAPLEMNFRFRENNGFLSQ
ncbi:Uncharacterised protein [Legionella sainthelensi]|nr:Uncharacterised protein [Legionella sainthelensi]